MAVWNAYAIASRFVVILWIESNGYNWLSIIEKFNYFIISNLDFESSSANMRVKLNLDLNVLLIDC